jgi:PqqD family protein of HPr-rel-A system
LSDPPPESPDSRDLHRWQAAAPELLDWAGWDGQYVVFHRPSGKTHLLNGETLLLLTRILDTPRSLPEVAGELAAAGIAVDDTEALGMLLRLEDLGLIHAR